MLVEDNRLLFSDDPLRFLVARAEIRGFWPIQAERRPEIRPLHQR